MKNISLYTRAYSLKSPNKINRRAINDENKMVYNVNIDTKVAQAK